jgi:glycosyltransferase involved in cell wall biosynthesis
MFSVIIPLYNKESFIARTLQSVLDQTFQEFEIIIVNDGSTDGSVKEVERFNDERIRLVEQTNAGVSAARNRGIEEAKYDMIAFLDADDEWLPDYLSEIYSLSLEYLNCNVFGTGYLLNNGSSIEIIRINDLDFTEDHGVLKNYFYIAANNMPPLCASAVCVKKTALLQVNGFPKGVKSGEDLLTWAKLAVFNSIAYSKRSLSIYHNEVQTWEPGRLITEEDFIGEELIRLLPRVSENYRKDFKKYLAHWHKMRASTFLRHNKRLLTLKEVLKIFRIIRFDKKAFIFLILCFMPYLIIQNIFKLRRGN